VLQTEDQIKVKLIGKEEQKRLKLTRKDALKEESPVETTTTT
jgi:hypothetical protein